MDRFFLDDSDDLEGSFLDELDDLDGVSLEFPYFRICHLSHSMLGA